MPNLDVKIEYSTESTVDSTALPVIIVAAGNSTRMSGIDKIFAPVYNVPLIVHTLRAFERNRFVSKIIVVAKQEDVLKMQNLVEKYAITKISDIVCGGDNRQESVKNGLSRLGIEDISVLIHDGARPVVSSAIIENVVMALKEHKSVTCGVPLKDTVKRVKKSNIVSETLKRNELVCVQTPQGVRVEDYFRAILSADLSDFTDDTSIMESVGIETLIVPGDYHNIKITTPEDLIIAQHYLKGDEEL